jgi:hypothetical protein
MQRLAKAFNAEFRWLLPINGTTTISKRAINRLHLQIDYPEIRSAGLY